MTKESGGVRKDSFALGTAGGIEYALQLLLPVVLVRNLTPEAFGDYRLVWLLAGAAIAIFPLSVPQSLFYYLSRATAAERRIFIGNAFLFVLIGGLIAGVGLAMGWSWMPPAIRDLERYSLLVPVFLALWVAGSMIEVLPNADGNARWQAVSMVWLAFARVILLALAAILSQDADVLLITMCAVALVRVLLVPTYAFTAASTRGLGIRITLLVRQVRYSFMFALGNTLFMLRRQADQWVVAFFFDSAVFALISIAAVVGSFSTLIRRPLNNATLPRLGLLVGQGRLDEARRLQARAFSALSLTLLPGLGLLFVGAPEIVEIVYTPAYLGAAPLMQIYLVGHIVGIYSAGHLLVTLNAGRLAATISAVGVVMSVTLSVVGVHLLGLPGAVAGSVVSLIIGEAWALFAVARYMGTTVSGLLDWPVIARSLGVVILATIVTLVAKEILLSEMHPVIRLTIATTSFLLMIVIGAVATNLHTKAIELLRGFKQNSNASP